MNPRFFHTDDLVQGDDFSRKHQNWQIAIFAFVVLLALTLSGL